MPRDSHRTVGKLLALSFWEDFAILDQMIAYIPTVFWLCAAPAFPHTLYTQGNLSFIFFTVQNIPGYVGLMCDRNTQDLLNLKDL